MCRYIWTGIFCLYASTMFSEVFMREVPWTRDLLSTETAAVLSYQKARSKHMKQYSPRFDVGVEASVVPLTNLEVAAAFLAASPKTPKVAFRVEKQFLCDLCSDKIALTTVGSVEASSRIRAENPVFFEYAPLICSFGLGVGKHLLNKKNYYTQLYGYAFTGIGSHWSSYGSVLLGVQHVYEKKQTVSFSIEAAKSFSSTCHTYAGFATRRGKALSGMIWYTYRFDGGIRAAIGATQRIVFSKYVKNATQITVSCSIPISW